MTLSGAARRNKGATAERSIAEAIREAGWPNARRTHDGRAQIGRGDIANGPAGCHIEVKRQEKLNVPAAFDQVRQDADTLDIPVLIHRPSRCDWMATLPLDELLPLLRLREAG